MRVCTWREVPAVIPLNGPHDGGRVVLVDAADHGTASRYRWVVTQMTRDKLRTEQVSAYIRRGKRMSLAKLLTGWEMTGHVNGDPLDCRRANLIRLDRSLQRAGIGPMPPRGKGPGSGYKGVWQARGQTRWQARVTWKGTRYHLGTFPDKESAAAAYDKKLTELAGPYAMTNQRLRGLIVPGADRAPLPAPGPERMHDVIVAVLRERLADGTYSRDGKAPTVTGLAAEFGVHKQTAQLAFAVLRGEGELGYWPGKGWYIPEVTA